MPLLAPLVLRATWPCEDCLRRHPSWRTMRVFQIELAPHLKPASPTNTERMYKWMPVTPAAGLSELKDHIPAEYDPITVAQKLAGGMSAAVKGVLIESE